MKKKILSVLTAALALTSCGQVSDTQKTNALPENAKAQVLSAQTGKSGVKSEASEDFVNGAADFSAELFKKIMAENGGENVLVSPESVIMCLGMVANGAENETLDELTQTLIGGSLETLNSGAKNWNDVQNDPENAENFKIRNANSAWIKEMENFSVKQDYINTVSDVFNADIVKAPFDQSTVDDINSWCSSKTDKMIPSLLDDLPESAKMVLINAVCFEAEWEDQYENHQCEREKFTSADGKESEVTMLNSTESYYVEDEKSTGFVKYYKGGYAFMAVLPNEDTSVSDYAASMTGNTLTSLFENRSSKYEVLSKLPEFTYDWDDDLSDTLGSLGINRAFDPENAQFGGMTDSTSLYIDKVIHKTHIELDRNGTRAAAATAALMCEGAIALDENEIKEVYLDRPFIYTIIDTTTNLPVFIGCVNQL